MLAVCCCPRVSWLRVGDHQDHDPVSKGSTPPQGHFITFAGAVGLTGNCCFKPSPVSGHGFGIDDYWPRKMMMDLERALWTCVDALTLQRPVCSETLSQKGRDFRYLVL